MITILISDCNHISQSFYDSVFNSLQLHQLSCSCGHSACLSIHAYYYRSVKLQTGMIRLRICRLICSECHKTHAVLLSSIVPYSQIRMLDQQRICVSYESANKPSGICDINPSIDENNVKTVIHNYRKFWREKLLSLRIALSPIPRLICSCFSNYSASFMQIHRMTNLLFVTPT